MRKMVKIMSIVKRKPEQFVRNLYTPQYRYVQGTTEDIIKQEIQSLIAEHDLSVWTPAGSTTIEVVNGKAYGRTEIYRDVDSNT